MEQANRASPRRAPARPDSSGADELVNLHHPSHALMNGRAAKSRTRSSCAKLPKASQGLLDAAFSQGARYTHDRIASLEPSRKRRIDARPDVDYLPAKRARSTRIITPRPRVEVEKAEQTAVKALRQPNPMPPKRPYASFLEDYVDALSPTPRPESSNSLVSGWLESVYGLGREQHCRSDSHLYRSDDNTVSRKLTKSAPAMGYTRDADGFSVPPTPASTGSRSHRGDDAQASSYAGSVLPSNVSGSGRSSALVEDTVYRSINLRENHIHLRSQYDEFPDHIAYLIGVARRTRASPGPSLEELRRDTVLESLEFGVGEPEVEDYFRDKILPSKLGGGLKRSDRQPHAETRYYPQQPHVKVQTFTATQQIQLGSMGKQVQANSLDLIYPFFVLEFKGDGPAGTGSMWVATNQCLGASATCVNMVDQLNRQLEQYEDTSVRAVDNAAFSVATNGIEARLFISWKHDDLDFYMQKIDSFILQKPEDYVQFRACIRNIVDWGRDKRLKEIRNSLDRLLEESRRTSELTKHLAQHSDGSATSSGKKRKSSSSSRSKSIQGHGDTATEPYWKGIVPTIDISILARMEVFYGKRKGSHHQHHEIKCERRVVQDHKHPTINEGSDSRTMRPL